MQPALLDLLTRVSPSIDSLGINPHSFPILVWPTTFSGSLSVSLARTAPREEMDLNELIESGERCDTESCSSPSSGGTRRMLRVSALQSSPSRVLCTSQPFCRVQRRNVTTGISKPK